MAWVRLDDNFADHPKIIALSDKAFRLFIVGLCYSNRQLTDGYIPYQMVSAWVGDDPFKPSDELEDQELWERKDKGFLIRSYSEYQPTKSEIEKKREAGKERLKRYRESKRERNADETLTPIPYPTQPIPNPNEDIKDNYSLEPISEDGDYLTPWPRVHQARQAVERIAEKLQNASRNGINAWNLSKLVEEEWDKFDPVNEAGACIALTVWYVSELQSRKLTSTEIARIGQMTKRFGRISLLAIDEAASKDLEDLVSYAFRIAQRMYADRKATDG